MMKTLKKTLGPQSATLVTRLYENRQSVFVVEDAARILGLPSRKASAVVRKAAHRGLFTSAGRGVYNLVPFELGDVSSHLDDRYLLVNVALGKIPHFLSHASALDLHRLVTQPNFDVYASSTHRLRDRIIGGNLAHFVTLKPQHMFGITEHDLGDNRFVQVSDIERTLVDAVRQPEYCGGITEVGKAFFMTRGRCDAARIEKYASLFNNSAVVRRAGFFMELFELADKALLERMRKSLPLGALKLDPSLDLEGPFRKDWGLRLNVSTKTLLAAVGN